MFFTIIVEMFGTIFILIIVYFGLHTSLWSPSNNRSLNIGKGQSLVHTPNLPEWWHDWTRWKILLWCSSKLSCDLYYPTLRKFKSSFSPSPPWPYQPQEHQITLDKCQMQKSQNSNWSRLIRIRLNWKYLPRCVNEFACNQKTSSSSN